MIDKLYNKKFDNIAIIFNKMDNPNKLGNKI